MIFPEAPLKVNGAPGNIPGNLAALGVNTRVACGTSTSRYKMNLEYRQTSNISHTLAGNKIVDHSDVVGASPVGAAPTTFSLST